MTTPVSQARRILEEATFAALLRIRQNDGHVSNEDVRNAATTLRCSERRIRRILARGYVRRPTVWRPDKVLAQHLEGETASTPQIHAALCRDGMNPGVSVRTLQRYIADQYRQRGAGEDIRGIGDRS
jgi:hypothetical protein